MSATHCLPEAYRCTVSRAPHKAEKMSAATREFVPAGLTAAEADVAILEGTPAHAQAMAARQVQP